MLEAHSVTLAHGSRAVVSDATLAVAPRQVVALCGPNGAGKSTLLAALTGEMRPRAGRVTIGGLDISGLSPAALAEMRAVLEQSPRLSAAFSVAMLATLGIPRAVPPARAEAIVTEMLAEVGLAGLADQPVDRLSGGQQHRAHLARALAQLAAGRALGKGGYLLLDEPTASLDLAHQAGAMRAAHRAARAGAGVVVVLHDLNLAAAFADRIVLMNEGRILIDDTPERVLTEDRLVEVYAAPLRVESGPGGRPCVLPVYPQMDTDCNPEEPNVAERAPQIFGAGLRLSQRA